MKCSKQRYPNLHAADRARSKISRKRGYLLHPYLCRACNAWHLGNDRETRLENMNRLFDRLPPSDRAPHLRPDA